MEAGVEAGVRMKACGHLAEVGMWWQACGDRHAEAGLFEACGGKHVLAGVLRLACGGRRVKTCGGIHGGRRVEGVACSGGMWRPECGARRVVSGV